MNSASSFWNLFSFKDRIFITVEWYSRHTPLSLWTLLFVFLLTKVFHSDLSTLLASISVTFFMVWSNRPLVSNMFCMSNWIFSLVFHSAFLVPFLNFILSTDLSFSEEVEASISSAISLVYSFPREVVASIVSSFSNITASFSPSCTLVMSFVRSITSIIPFLCSEENSRLISATLIRVPGSFRIAPFSTIEDPTSEVGSSSFAGSLNKITPPGKVISSQVGTISTICLGSSSSSATTLVSSSIAVPLTIMELISSLTYFTWSSVRYGASSPLISNFWNLTIPISAKVLRIRTE